MKKIPIGEDNFRELNVNDCYYVDKTKAIEDILLSGTKVYLFTRPRRFGKSLFISMLEHFFDVEKKDQNKNLFDGLYISKSKRMEHSFKYPVINIDFKDLKCESLEELYEKIKIVISEIYKSKKYLLDKMDEDDKEIFRKICEKEADTSDYSFSLMYLSKWLYTYYGERTVILIDEYDTPIQEAYINGFYEKAIKLIKPMLSACLKGNDSLHKGILTGILRVSKENMFSDLNNLEVIGLMDSDVEYFGFSEEEAQELFKYYGLELTSDVRAYYDGYVMNKTHVFNPWSLLNYVKKKELEPYWINTSGNRLIKKMLARLSPEDKIVLENLLLGESVSFIIDPQITYIDFNDSNIDNVFNLLFSNGYLTYDKTEKFGSREINYFKIPNKEVENYFIKIMEEITFERVISMSSKYIEFSKALLVGKKEKVEEFINSTLRSMSYYDSRKDLYENFFQGYMLSLLSLFIEDEYIIKSNRETGNGRCDYIVRKSDNSVGLILELKWCKEEKEMEEKALEGIKQIKEKNYREELELEKVKDIYEYTIVFSNKSCIVR